MSDTISTPTVAKLDWRRGPKPRRRVPAIKLPNGDSLVLRKNFADEIGADEKSVRGMDLPTTYIGGVAYVPHDASLNIIAATAMRRNQGPTRVANRPVPHRVKRKGRR
jgi:hypothetical protein